MKKACIICDIDGVFVDSREWSKYAPSKHDDKEGWKEFAKHINVCKPNLPVIKLIGILGNTFTIIFLTSREGTNFTREKTVKQIESFSNGKITLNKNKLFMRKPNDFRESFEVKEEILKRDILPFYNPIIAIDDDKGNIDMFKRNDINTIHYTKLRF